MAEINKNEKKQKKNNRTSIERWKAKNYLITTSIQIEFHSGTYVDACLSDEII
jgi:kynurenine formamidase